MHIYTFDGNYDSDSVLKRLGFANLQPSFVLNNGSQISIHYTDQLSGSQYTVVSNIVNSLTGSGSFYPDAYNYTEIARNVVFDDFLGSTNIFTKSTTSGGTISNVGNAGESDLQISGIWYLRITNATGSRSTIYLPQNSIKFNGQTEMEFNIKTQNLAANSTDKFVVDVGLFSNPTTLNSNSMLVFRYDFSNASSMPSVSGSPNWYCVKRNNTIWNIKNSQIPVSNSNYSKLTIKYNNGIVYFLINGAIVSTFENDIPGLTNEDSLNLGINIARVSGGGTREVRVDYFNIIKTQP